MHNTINNQENANQNCNEISPPVKIAIIKNKQTNKQQVNVGEDVEKREHLCTVDGKVN